MATALLDQIRITALTTQMADPSDELIITQNGCALLPTAPSKSSISCSVTKSLLSCFQQMCLSSPQPSIAGEHQVKNLTPTLSSLQQIFGANRLERNCAFINRYSSQDSKIQKKVTLENYQTLLYCLFLTTKEDFEELLLEIQSTSTEVRGVTGEALKKVRELFAKKTIETCSKAEIDQLETLLLPFSHLKDVFLKDASYTQTCVHAPATFAAMMEKAAWGKYLLKTREWTEDEWEYLFGKVFSPPLLPDHLVLPHKQGYMYMSHVVEGDGASFRLFALRGGASFRLFAPLGTSTTDPLILGRSTRCLMPTDGLMESFLSVADNLRENPGSGGCIATAEKINELLRDPKLGFVKTPHQQIQVIGYSQGGAHAQYLAALFAPRIKKLTTISSIAPAPEVQAKFAKVSETMTVLHMQDWGDVVPFFGGVLTHNDTVQVKVFRAVVEPPEDFSKKNAWRIASDIMHLPQTLDKFSKAHSRLTVAESYEVRTFEKEKAKLLCQHDPSVIDPSWEEARLFACIFPSLKCPDITGQMVKE